MSRRVTSADSPVRSYATRAGLLAGLRSLGLQEHYYHAARTPDGRWTAVFPAVDFKPGVGAELFAGHGFLTLTPEELPE